MQYLFVLVLGGGWSGDVSDAANSKTLKKMRGISLLVRQPNPVCAKFPIFGAYKK